MSPVPTRDGDMPLAAKPERPRAEPPAGGPDRNGGPGGAPLGGGVGGPPAAVQPDPVAIASLVCGILSLLFVCCCGILVFLLGPAAIGLGIWACNRIQADPGQLSGLGMAYTGIGLGAGGLVLEVILLILSVGINLLPAFLG